MKKKFFGGSAFILVFFSCIAFWYGFMRGSDFAWTVQQVEYWNAIVEMIFAFWLYFIILQVACKKNVYRYAGIGIVFLSLAFLHAFFWATIIGLVYCVMLYLTGYLICYFLNKGNEEITKEAHICMVTGIAGIICMVGILSFFNCGTPEKLRVIFVAFFLLEIIISRKYISRIIKKYWKEVFEEESKKTDYLTTVILALILTVITIVICRANLGLDYDSTWYGLRSQYVLAPENGIYDKNMMLACVYTYSKGFEILTLVFSGLSSYSFIFAINIMFGILILLAVYRLGQVIGLSKRIDLFLVLLVVLTPSIMNMTITAKSDIVTLYLQVVALIFGVRAVKEYSGKLLTISMSILILTLGFKPTSIIFSFVLAIIILATALCLKIRPSFSRLRVVVLYIVGLVFIWGRTIVITGYPITSLVVSFLKKIGYYPKYPYTLPTTNTSSLSDLIFSGEIWMRIKRLVKLFFAPNTGDIVTLEISWWGNLFTVIWIVAVLSIVFRPMYVWKKMKKNAVYAFQVVSVVIFSILSLGCMILLSTPDGNYFMLLYVLTYWYGASEISECNWQEKKALFLTSIPLIICNFLLCIAISPAWIVGLTPIDLKNCGYYNHKEKYVYPLMQYNSLSDMYNYMCIKENMRVITYSDKEQTMFMLPAITEGYLHMQIWGGDTLQSSEALWKYIDCAGIEGVLIDESYAKKNKEGVELFLQIAEKGNLKIGYVTEGYVLLEVANEKMSNDETVIYLKELLAFTE